LTRSSGACAIAACCAVVILTGSLAGAGRKFYDDDPLAREPETQDASGVQPWEIDLAFDLSLNLFARPGDPTPNVRALNINTIDEVPDSSWFTNRILARPVSVDEATQGPLSGSGPAPGTWVVTRAKEAGVSPGFTVEDANQVTWFISFDPRGYPEGATASILVANKIFWTLGYWQIENYLISVRPEQLVIGDSAIVRPPSGKLRPMKPSDIEDVFGRAQPSADGSYRAVAARAAPGKALGGFRYHDTRPDDPNDVIPHEHRRELRALKVFGAWTNLVDMKAGNTLDTLVTADGRAVVRHYLQDVGSTFGMGALAPLEYDEGWEHLFQGETALKRLLTLGFFIQPWQTVPYPENRAVGRFEGAVFDPTAWKPRAATAAFLRARNDDNFWAARRVMAFSDEMIRALAEQGRYSDPKDARLLGDVLIQRRDAVGRAYLSAVNPLVNFAMSAAGELTFENAAVKAGMATEPAGGYSVTWARFDNENGTDAVLGTQSTTGGRVQASVTLPAAPGSFIKVQVSAVQPVHASWAVPVDVYFRRNPAGWVLVGLERLP
jgi:hypothetical protein